MWPHLAWSDPYLNPRYQHFLDRPHLRQQIPEFPIVYLNLNIQIKADSLVSVVTQRLRKLAIRTASWVLGQPDKKQSKSQRQTPLNNEARVKSRLFHFSIRGIKIQADSDLQLPFQATEEIFERTVSLVHIERCDGEALSLSLYRSLSAFSPVGI